MRPGAQLHCEDWGSSRQFCHGQSVLEIASSQLCLGDCIVTTWKCRLQGKLQVGMKGPDDIGRERAAVTLDTLLCPQFTPPFPCGCSKHFSHSGSFLPEFERRASLPEALLRPQAE